MPNLRRTAYLDQYEHIEAVDRAVASIVSSSQGRARRNDIDLEMALMGTEGAELAGKSDVGGEIAGFAGVALYLRIRTSCSSFRDKTPTWMTKKCSAGSFQA